MGGHLIKSLVPYCMSYLMIHCDLKILCLLKKGRGVGRVPYKQLTMVVAVSRG